jgi:hypothetical protein
VVELEPFRLTRRQEPHRRCELLERRVVPVDRGSRQHLSQLGHLRFGRDDGYGALAGVEQERLLGCTMAQLVGSRTNEARLLPAGPVGLRRTDTRCDPGQEG